MRQWTPAERNTQASLIRQWKPWRKSTGPKTESGKNKSAQNALKHGMRSAKQLAELRLLNEALRQCRDFARQC